MKDSEDSNKQYQKQENSREFYLFETDAARYYLVQRQEYQPITGGVNFDFSLRRLEKERK